MSRAKRAATGTATTRPRQGDVRLDARRQGADPDSARRRRERAATSAPASKRRSPMPAAARSPATRSSTPPTARSSCRRSRATRCHPAGEQVAGQRARARLLGAPQPNVPVTLDARAPAISERATTTSPRSRAISRRRGHDRRRRPRHCRRHAADRRAAASASRVTASSGRELDAGSRVALGAGPQDDHRRGQRRSVSSSCWPSKSYAARRVGAAGRPRRNGHRPGAGHQGRPARVVVPVAAARRRRLDRGADRCRRRRRRLRQHRLPARRPAVSRRAAPRRARGRAHAERGGDRRPGGIEAARSGRRSRDGDRSRRRSRCARRSASP